MTLRVPLDVGRRLEMRIYGSLCQLFVFGGSFAVHQFESVHGGHNTPRLPWPMVAIVALGICLLCVQLWAELIFILSLTVIGITFGVGALVEGFRNTPWVLLNLPFLTIFLIPLMLNWKRLLNRTFFAHGAQSFGRSRA